MKKFYRRKVALKYCSLIISIIISIFIFLCGCSQVLHSSGLYSNDYSLVKEILGPINDARSTGKMCGNKYYKLARPVVWNDTLGQAALRHSLDMAQKGFLGHTGSDGRGLGERLSKVGYRWSSCGENVGQGFETPEEAVRLWLKSEVHCKNIMNPYFKEAGAAFAKSVNRRSYWTLILGNSKQ
jgi:uncharacterized protein YkwD